MNGLFDLLFLALVVWWILRSVGQAMGGETGEGRPEGGFDLEDVLRGRTSPRTEGPSGPGAPEGAEPSRRKRVGAREPEGGERERLMASIRDEIAEWNQTREETEATSERPTWVRRAEARMGRLTRERELAEAAERELQVGEPSEAWRLEGVRGSGEGRESPIRSVRDESAPLEERKAAPRDRSTAIGGPLSEGEIGSRGFPGFGELPDREVAPRRPPRPVRRKGRGAGGRIPDFADRSSLSRAILYREILGPPRALSPWRGTGYGES